MIDKWHLQRDWDGGEGREAKAKRKGGGTSFVQIRSIYLLILSRLFW
jgi:hypothetical protein